MEPVVLTNPQTIVSPEDRPATEPADDPAVDPACHSLLLIGCPNRPLNLEGPVTRELSLVGLKTMSHERLSQSYLLRTVLLKRLYDFDVY